MTRQIGRHTACSDGVKVERRTDGQTRSESGWQTGMLCHCGNAVLRAASCFQPKAKMEPLRMHPLCFLCISCDCSSFKIFIFSSSAAQPQTSPADYYTAPVEHCGLKSPFYCSKHCWGRWQWLSSIPHRSSQPHLGFKPHSEWTYDTPVTSFWSVFST